MSDYQIAYNATTRVATIQAANDGIPVGSEIIGTFSHGAAEEDTEYSIPETHVLWHHVRDALYHEGEYNMQTIEIQQDVTYIPVLGLSISPATTTKAVAATQQLTPTFDPVSPSNTVITYTTSDATKATVSASGLITAVATGSATITATTSDGAFTDTCVVTIS